MIESFVKSVNKNLVKYSLSLNNKKVNSEYNNVEKDWEAIASKISKPIKYLIIGEATVSYENYFYNPESAITSFLTPSHFNCSSKGELIELFQNKGVLVFDLYPLPLPTFIYDNVRFDCANTSYQDLLSDYFGTKLNGLIDENTIIVLRYIKLLDRCEWKLLVEYLRSKGVREFFDISKSINADEIKINNVFNDIIT